ncbi:sugar phosphate isomerase/epimerase family protein [Paenibacillus sp. Soil522]|uniref:sugar phosphate isomerase/epimerase family protein n=1 Tax=Paenibacillus sp. Soil522 TaxID=1736388 RepID=UPI0006F7DA2B|nr:TIM barrel protein [Paenibacillus sp. Soil522]KRE34981.1 hypothetical protein ASG81_22480 [Paenibacillus sp. Soil522]
MAAVIVTTSAFGADQVMERGQLYFVPIVADAGGNGIEIRRELFANEPFPLEELKAVIHKYRLTAVYSAPEQIWKEDGKLNLEGIRATIQEGVLIGTSIIKMPLGNYRPDHSDLQLLKRILGEYNFHDSGIQFTVENDQTFCGGRIERLREFLARCKVNDIPVKMTFDIGNWAWTDTNTFEAAEQMKPYVVYIHCKHVEQQSGINQTLPLPTALNAAWRKLLSVFPPDIPRAIEFPLNGSDITGTTAKYIQLLTHA